MWPKALAQLVELAPHITRLAPLADRFLKDKASGDHATQQALDSQRGALEAQRAAVTNLGDRLHAEIGAITSAQSTQNTHFAALGKQIGDLEKQLATSRSESLTARQGAESLATRMQAVEGGQRRLQSLLYTALALLVILLVLAALLLFRAPAH